MSSTLSPHYLASRLFFIFVLLGGVRLLVDVLLRLLVDVLLRHLVDVLARDLLLLVLGLLFPHFHPLVVHPCDHPVVLKYNNTN